MKRRHRLKITFLKLLSLQEWIIRGENCWGFYLSLLSSLFLKSNCEQEALSFSAQQLIHCAVRVTHRTPSPTQIQPLLSLLFSCCLPINYECKAGSCKICCIFYYLHVKGHKSSSVKSAIKQWQVLLSAFFIAYYLRWQQLLHNHCTAYHIICS